MQILVLGATGFTGSALLVYLCNMKGNNITAVVHNRPPINKHCNVTYLHSSLEKINAAFLEEGKFDYIFHLARIPGKSFGDIGRYYAGLKGGIVNRRLLKTINSLKEPPKLIYLSGSLMYGDKQKATETDKLNPAGFAKYYYLAEKSIIDAISTGTDNIMVLRAPWILGNGSWYKQLYATHIQKHNSVPVYGDINRRMSVVPVEDCAGMLWHYAANAQYGKLYNIYTFRDIPYNDFIHDIATAYNCHELKQYDENNMVQMLGKTTAKSVCCDVTLDTVHSDMLNSYQALYPDLAEYITQLAKTNNG